MSPAGGYYTSGGILTSGKSTLYVRTFSFKIMYGMTKTLYTIFMLGLSIPAAIVLFSIIFVSWYYISFCDMFSNHPN